MSAPQAADMAVRTLAQHYDDGCRPCATPAVPDCAEGERLTDAALMPVAYDWRPDVLRLLAAVGAALFCIGAIDRGLVLLVWIAASGGQ